MVLVRCQALATLAMLDYPFACDFVTPMPANPVKYACGLVETAAASADPIAGLNAAVRLAWASICWICWICWMTIAHVILSENRARAMHAAPRMPCAMLV